MLLTDGVIGWKSSKQTHCAKFLTGHGEVLHHDHHIGGIQNGI